MRSKEGERSKVHSPQFEVRNISQAFFCSDKGRCVAGGYTIGVDERILEDRGRVKAQQSVTYITNIKCRKRRFRFQGPRLAAKHTKPGVAESKVGDLNRNTEEQVPRASLRLWVQCVVIPPKLWV